MCAMCEGGSREQHLEEVARIAADVGWAVQAVQRDRKRPPWAAHVLHASVPPPGEQVPLVGGPLVKFVALPGQPVLGPGAAS